MVWFLQGNYFIFRLHNLLMFLFNLDYSKIDPDNISNRGDAKTFDILLKLRESY